MLGLGGAGGIGPPPGVPPGGGIAGSVGGGIGGIGGGVVWSSRTLTGPAAGRSWPRALA